MASRSDWKLDSWKGGGEFNFSEKEVGGLGGGVKVRDKREYLASTYF